MSYFIGLFGEYQLKPIGIIRIHEREAGAGDAARLDSPRVE
jgi:hypothetical protein